MDSVERGNKDGLQDNKDLWAYSMDQDYREAYDYAAGVKFRQEMDSETDLITIAANALGEGLLVGAKGGGSKKFEDGYFGKSLTLTSVQQRTTRQEETTNESSSSVGSYRDSPSYSSDYGFGGGYSGTFSSWRGRTSTYAGVPAWIKWMVGLIFCVLILNLLTKYVQYPTRETSVKREPPEHMIPAFKYIVSRVTEDAELGAVALIRITNREVILFSWKTIGDPKRLLLFRLTPENRYYSTDSVLEVPFTDFAFLLVYVGDYKFDNNQIKVFAEKGSFWRSDGGPYSEFYPEDNSTNVLPVTIEPLDLDEKQVFLISPLGGDFPQDSQLVLQLTYPKGYYIERFFTNSTIQELRIW